MEPERSERERSERKNSGAVPQRECRSPLALGLSIDSVFVYRRVASIAAAGLLQASRWRCGLSVLGNVNHYLSDVATFVHVLYRIGDALEAGKARRIH